MKKAITQKILVILGPTATGKSDLAVKLAKKYNGEVISADSRQVYSGLDIGSGKISKKEMLEVPHHMLDLISIKKTYSVSDWQKAVQKIITEIISRGKTPMICGGTGFYIQSIVDGIVLPEVPPNGKLRKELEAKNVKELFSILKKLDSKRAQKIDKENPVRLLRAIEIAKAIGKVPEIKKQKSTFEFLQIGLTLPQNELNKKIHSRLLSRTNGMIREAKNLHKKGTSWKRMERLGLEYRYLSRLLQDKISKKTFLSELEKEIIQYSKRQMTWFKRDKNILWFSPQKTKKIDKQIKLFLA